jgi:glycosyltransferase involved in cell wall biosynthesis
MRVELAPPEEVLRIVSPYEVTSSFRNRFFSYEPRGVTAIHSHVFPWFIEWCRSRKTKDAKWVHTYHLPYFLEHANGRMEAWQEEFNRSLVEDARHADVRLSVSRWQQDFLDGEHGISTTYLPNGVDVLSCDNADGTRFRDSTGLEDFVLYVGRNDPVKNPVEFVRLAARMPSTRLVMIGHGLSEAVVAEMAGSVAPSNLVIRGEASHAAILDAIAASSAVVVTSKREGLPTLVLEAMALEKNIVVPREAGCLEAVGEEGAGISYEPGALDDLEEKTRRALSLPPNTAGRVRVLEEFDWRVVAAKLDRVYTS